MTSWYEAKTGNDQGLVIEEETGRNVAVTYDKADARLVAAAPELLDRLIEAADYIDDQGDEKDDDELHFINELRAAIAKALGNGKA
jgi:hypothetical protein